MVITIKWPALLNNQEKDVTGLSLGLIDALKTCNKAVTRSPENIEDRIFRLFTNIKYEKYVPKISAGLYFPPNR